MEKSIEVRKRVCVTGAGGFIASWLVKLLLDRGYTVRGTVEVIAPAVTGTLNVLEACSGAKIKRAVVVSSVAAVSMTQNWPQDEIIDETCWSDDEYCRATENWYSLSKTLAEKEALAYAEKQGLDVVTVCPSMVLGPLLQSNVHASSFFLINILKGNCESTENRIKHFVDVRDVAEALIMVYEKPEALGRYICAPHPMKISDFMDMLKSKYPNYHYPKQYTETDNKAKCSIEKLKKLGWTCRDLKETLVATVEYYKKACLVDGE